MTIDKTLLQCYDQTKNCFQLGNLGGKRTQMSILPEGDIFDIDKQYNIIPVGERSYAISRYKNLTKKGCIVYINTQRSNVTQNGEVHLKKTAEKTQFVIGISSVIFKQNKYNCSQIIVFLTHQTMINICYSDGQSEWLIYDAKKDLLYYYLAEIVKGNFADQLREAFKIKLPVFNKKEFITLH